MSSLKPRSVGVAGGILLVVLFLAIVSVSESWAHAWGLLGDLWPWIALLSTGFGLQAGLYWYIRRERQRRQAEGMAAVAASGGVSTGAMVACCLHHGTDVLPVLGLTALTPLLTRYQPLFLTAGVMANLFGISVMLLTIKRLGLYQPGAGILGRLALLDLRRVRHGIIAASFVVLAVVLLASCSRGGQPATPAPAAAPAAPVPRPQEAEAGGLTVKVSPATFSPGAPLRFEVAFDTHQGALDFDPVQAAALEDSLGDRYQAVSWEGMGPEGHHRSGTLTFPAPATGAQWIKLSINGLYGVPERSFRWTVP